MNDLELKVLALGEAHRRIRDREEYTTDSPEIIANLLLEMHHSASAMRDMVRMELGLCTDLERKLNHWIFPLALWEREREAREDAQREDKLQAMYSQAIPASVAEWQKNHPRPASTAQADMRDHMSAKNKIGNSEPYYGNMDTAECVDRIPETEPTSAKLDLVVTLNGVPFRDQTMGIEMFKAACQAEIAREIGG